MKKQNILIIGLILLAVISFGIFILVSGKGNTGSLETTKDIIKMINTIDKDNKNVLPELETMKVDVKNIDEVTSYTGLKTNDDIESIVVSVPMMTSQAYSVAVVKVKDTANVEKIKQEMLDNIDMRRWICVSAEQLYITNSGNVIFSVMADKDIAKVVYNDFKKYVNNITSIKINGVEKTGKGGIKATDLFDADGNINFNAAIKGKDGSSTPVFADKSASYTIELTSTGYPSVSGTVQLNTSILEASIKKAEALDSSKYTAETWKALQTALTEAKEAKSANTQAIVDAANTKLTEALSGLKEKAVTPSKPATPSNPDTTTTKKPATKPALKKSNVKLSKPVLKVGKTTKNKAKVTWKKVKKATGYEIQYTTKGFGNKKDTKTIKVSKAKITSAQLKKLKKKKTYYIRVRAYKMNGKKKVYGKWSTVKKVKIKK